jgi:predicted ATP-binding protein involved in virulence
MKINKITVDDLFGVFHHEILINNEVGITIIIGENGLGKTVLLEMIESFFKGNYQYFNNVDFKEMIYDFDDGTKWMLHKETISGELPKLDLTQVNKNGTTYKPLKLVEYDREQLDVMAHRIARSNPNLRRIGPGIWRDRNTGERIHIEELPYRHDMVYQRDLFFTEDERPKWFQDKYDKIQVSLIETQRLISTEKRDRDDQIHKPTVEKYSTELSKTIKSYLTESTELSSKLDRTYPNRLINRLKKSSNLTKEDLNNELKALEAKREMLDTVGLIEIEKDSSLLEIEDPQDVIIDVLKLYVEDSFEKIKIFDTLSRKIEILLDIINKRFKHKKMYIDRDNGFLFMSTIIKDAEDNYQVIPVSKLSSGEQNELVLFYLLLFKTEPNSLILIDEPEVSLHISWQNSFISDLKEITKLNNLDVLIATHSPDIIADNWDLKTDLRGLE